MTRVLVALSIAGVAMSSSGCALLFTKAQPNEYSYTPGQRYDCGSGRGLAVVDVLFASVEAALGVAVYYRHRSSGHLGDESAPFAFLAPAFLHAASAIHGFRTSNRCERIIEDLDRRAAEAPDLNVGVPATSNAEPTLCGFDAQCGDQQICVAQRCVAPSPQAVPPTQLAPPHQAPPASAPTEVTP